MDSTLAARMVDVIEQLLIERRALRSILHVMQHRLPPLSQLDPLIDQATNNPTILESVRKEVAPLRDHIHSPNELEKALQEFLRIAPPGDDVR